MKKLIINRVTIVKIVILSIFLISPMLNKGELNVIDTSIETSSLPKQYDKVILITWDGTRSKWLDEFTDSNYLSAARTIRDSGFNTTIHIASHDISTDPGLATLESGYGPDVTGIYSNQFGGSLSIPDNYTTSERLKNSYGDNVTTGMLLSWGYHKLPDDAAVLQNDMTDSTFGNIEPGKDIDFWYASENVTWSPDNPIAFDAALSEFVNRTDKGVVGWKTLLLRADFLGRKAAEFINNNTENAFYLRMHLTEPDQAGHGYGESVNGEGNVTDEYLNSLKMSDMATQYIIDELKTQGIYNDTLIILATDHGFKGTTHGGDPFPNGDPAMTDLSYYFSQDLGYDADTILLEQRQISPLILGIFGLNPTTFTPSFVGSLPWDFVPEVVSTSSSSVTSSSSTVTTSTTDEVTTTDTNNTSSSTTTKAPLILFLFPNLFLIVLVIRKKSKK